MSYGGNTFIAVELYYVVAWTSTLQNSLSGSHGVDKWLTSCKSVLEELAGSDMEASEESMLL